MIHRKVARGGWGLLGGAHRGGKQPGRLDSGDLNMVIEQVYFDVMWKSQRDCSVEVVVPWFGLGEPLALPGTYLQLSEVGLRRLAS